MALLIPRLGQSWNEVSGLTAANAEFGTSVAANASAHTKTATPVQLLASSTYDAFGIIIGVGNVGTAATTNTRTLVDIMVGGSGSEAVLIPNLMAGQVGASASASSQPQYYYFPLYIPAGTRLSARSQSVTGSDTVNVTTFLIQNQIPGKWYGHRVTDYGTSTATSSGTSHTPAAAGSYATTTQLTASTTNRIRAMQIGIDLLTDTTGTNARGLVRIAAMGSTNYIVSGLAFRESTTLESLDYTQANFALSQMMFDIPAGQYLGVGGQLSTSEARGFAIYGVD
jgi:hypothetical protein